jgi:hypothetical protein
MRVSRRAGHGLVATSSPKRPTSDVECDGEGITLGNRPSRDLERGRAAGCARPNVTPAAATRSWHGWPKHLSRTDERHVRTDAAGHTHAALGRRVEAGGSCCASSLRSVRRCFDCRASQLLDTLVYRVAGFVHRCLGLSGGFGNRRGSPTKTESKPALRGAKISRLAKRWAGPVHKMRASEFLAVPV